MKKDYELFAVEYAEKYGILSWKVKRNLMIYYRNYHCEHNTYKIVVNLDTFKEVERIRLKRYYKIGYLNSWC